MNSSSDSLQLGFVVGTATAINAVDAMQHNKDAVTRLVASGVLYFVLVVFGGLTKRWDLSLAVAWVFLLSSAFARGLPLVHSLTAVSTSAAPAMRTSGGSF